MILFLLISISTVITSSPFYHTYNNSPKLFLSHYDYGISIIDIRDDYKFGQKFNLIYNSSSSIKSIDYSQSEKYIVFQENDAIKRANFDPQYDTIVQVEKVEVIVESGVSKFTLDPVHDLIYYKVRNKRQIIVVDVTDPTKFNTIISDTKRNVGDIKVDPISGLIFYTQWDDGEMAQLISANQDGTNRYNILENVYLKEPTSFSIDSMTQTIYLIDTKLFLLASIDYKGNYRIIIGDRRDLFQYTRSIDIYKNQIIWTFSKKVYLIPTYGNEFNLRLTFNSKHDIGSIKVYDPLRQPYALNLCYNNYCSYLCIPSAQRRYACVCPPAHSMTTTPLCKESMHQVFDYTQTISHPISEYSELYKKIEILNNLWHRSQVNIIALSVCLVVVALMVVALISYVCLIRRYQNSSPIVAGGEPMLNEVYDQAEQISNPLQDSDLT